MQPDLQLDILMKVHVSLALKSCFSYSFTFRCSFYGRVETINFLFLWLNWNYFMLLDLRRDIEKFPDEVSWEIP